LVGVVDGDLGLAGGDLRAGERTYQLLHQISGRAGREMAHGKVLVQTYQPEHPVMQALASEGRDAFMNVEAEYRHAAHMPPFSRLVALVVEGVKEYDVTSYARALAKAAPEEKGIVVWGPAPAPLARLKGKHRWRVLLKTERSIVPQHYMNRWLALCPPPRTLRLKIDVDPYSFV
jgi:primosomal protein N' (replication factor Y)